MSRNTVQEIENAIETLTPQEREELYTWIDQQPQPIDTLIESGLAAGAFDDEIQKALNDEVHDGFHPL